MGQLDLPHFILQQIRPRALQHAQGTALKTRRMLLGNDPFSTRLDANHRYRFVVNEGIKQPDRI